MNDFNKMDFSKIKVGDKVCFRYSKNDKKSEIKNDNLINVRLKDEYFLNEIEKIKKNYDKRKQKNKMIKTQLLQEYKILNDIKGKYDNDSKLLREKIKIKVNGTIRAIQSNYIEKEKTGVLFFKKYSNKDIDKNNSYTVICWYIGEVLDIRNGKEGPMFIQNTGKIQKHLFDHRIMEEIKQEEKNN